MSQTDAAKGFGGKFGVLKDRQDKVGTIQGWGPLQGVGLVEGWGW